MQIQKITNYSFKNRYVDQKNPIKINNTSKKARKKGVIIGLAALSIAAVGAAILITKNKKPIDLKKVVQSQTPNNKAVLNIDKSIVNAPDKSAAAIPVRENVVSSPVQVVVPSETVNAVRVNPSSLEEIPVNNQIPIIRHKRADKHIPRPITIQTYQFSKRVKGSPETFKIFGISDDLKNSVRSLPAEMLEAISDDELLAYIVAPTDKLKYTPDFISGTSRFSVKISKLTKEREKFHQVVENILPEKERAARIQQLEEIFTPSELKGIVEGQDEISRKKKTCLIKWLIGFNTKEDDAKYLDILFS